MCSHLKLVFLDINGPYLALSLLVWDISFDRVQEYNSIHEKQKVPH